MDFFFGGGDGLSIIGGPSLEPVTKLSTELFRFWNSISSWGFQFEGYKMCCRFISLTSKGQLSILPTVVVQKRNPLDLRQPSGDLCQQQVQEGQQSSFCQNYGLSFQQALSPKFLFGQSAYSFHTPSHGILEFANHYLVEWRRLLSYSGDFFGFLGFLHS